MRRSPIRVVELLALLSLLIPSLALASRAPLTDSPPLAIPFSAAGSSAGAGASLAEPEDASETFTLSLDQGTFLVGRLDRHRTGTTTTLYARPLVAIDTPLTVYDGVMVDGRRTVVTLDDVTWAQIDDSAASATATDALRDESTAPRGALREASFGPEGRLESKGSEQFHYDAEGHRTSDPRFDYAWDWRGWLREATVKAPPDSTSTPNKLVNTYDATGRLLTRTILGPLGEGCTTDVCRDFIEKRIYVWDGQSLAAETGLNHADEIIWRKLYVPGPSGLDDAVGVRVEKDFLSGSPQSVELYAILRDELGSPIALLRDQAVSATEPVPLLARFRYSPYGETHLELGPEPLRIRFDSEITSLVAPDGSTFTQQPPDPGRSVAGAIVVRTSLPLDPSTLDGGLTIEYWDDLHVGGPDWTPLTPAQIAADFAVGTRAGDDADLVVLRKTGWFANARYRIRLTGALKDRFGRSIQPPADASLPIAVLLDVPSDGATAPTLDRKFEIRYDSADAAGNTLGGAFPGGIAMGFQGVWTDPLTGLGYHRARWYDSKTAQWMSEDPLGDHDSPNLWSYVAGHPHVGVDPLGLAEPFLKEEREAIQAASRRAAAAEADAEQARVLAWNDAVMRLRILFFAEHGRMPTDDDELLRDPRGKTIYGSGGWRPSEGVEPDTVFDMGVVTILTAGQVGWVKAGVRGATRALADEAVGQVVGVNPSTVRSAARFIESAGARVLRNGAVSASAQSRRAFATSIRPDIAEKDAYYAALSRGEIGLQRPGGSNVPGVDFITATRVRGKMTIFVTDAKSSSKPSFPTPRTDVPLTWGQEVRGALARLDLGDPALEAEVRRAFAEGRVQPRQVNVDYSAVGQGAVTGF